MRLRWLMLSWLLVSATVFGTPPSEIPTVKASPTVSMGTPLSGEDFARPVPVVVHTPTVEIDPNKFVLTSDVVLMFETDAEVVFTSSPLGIAAIEKEAGPIRVRARFAQNPTKIQTRKYEKKWVYTIKPLNEGRCELMTWIVGETNAAKIQRFQVDVNLGPRPPPNPIDPPSPVPNVNPLPSDKLRVLFTFDDAKTLSKEHRAVLDSVLVHSAITKAGGDWRCWSVKDDPSQEAEWWRKAMARDRKQPSWFIISSPKGFLEGPLPATYQEMLTIIGKY